MIVCRFDENRVGLVENGFVRDVTLFPHALPGLRYPFPMSDVFIEALPELRQRLASRPRWRSRFPGRR